MSFALFNTTNKNKKGTGRLQVGLIEDSDDDDFIEPLVMVKKKKPRKLSGNDLLCISQKVTPSTQHLDITVTSSPTSKSSSLLSSPQVIPEQKGQHISANHVLIQLVTYYTATN